MLLLPAGPAFAATINVDATCTLAQAINEANAATTGVGSCEAGTDGSGATGADTINITADITLSAELPQIASAITINGNGRTISGADTHNIFDVRFTTGDLTINNLILTNGFENQGGAITAQGDVTLNDVVIKNSRAHQEGGALFISHSQADIVVNRSAFHNNTSATQGGGAMLLNGKTHKITNSTFYNNTITAGRYGAAIYLGLNRSTATYELNHVTITGNSGGVSALAVNQGALTMRNSIVYGNAIPDCVRDVDNASLTVNSGNIHTLSAPAATELVNCGTPFSTADPLLSSSATGSPPYFTIAANSPAVDGATCITGDNPITVDQRGTTRPQGSSCDIGAYELIPAPNASFTAAVDTSNVLLWNFDASGSSGPITSYAWTFGDGNSGTGETTTHTYSSGGSGSYTVTLTATGPGGSDSATRSISIPKPVASFTAAVDTGNVLLWNFDASGSSGPITSYAWTFGDGNSGTGETTTHTYSSGGSGSYTVTLTATGPGGSDSAMRSISISKPVASFTYSLDGNQASFTSTSTGSNLSFSWDVDGDGAPDYSDENPTHIYPDIDLSATYRVTLTVSNSAGSDSATRSIPDSQPVNPPQEEEEDEPDSAPVVLICPSRPGGQSRFGKIGSGEWRNHFARLGIQAANGAQQTEWARGDANVSGANVCMWEYECSTDGHWAYGHYHATHGHNYQAPGTRPPAAVNRSSGGAFNLCYSVWSGGCNSAEAWQFGHASGKQIYERWLYGRQLQAAPSGC